MKAPPSLLVECQDCGGRVLDLVPPGRHAPHWVGAKLLNCAGAEVAP